MKKILQTFRATILGLLLGGVLGISYGINKVDSRVQEMQAEKNKYEFEAATCKLEQEQGCICQQDAGGSYRRQVVGKWSL